MDPFVCVFVCFFVCLCIVYRYEKFAIYIGSLSDSFFISVLVISLSFSVCNNIEAVSIEWHQIHSVRNHLLNDQSTSISSRVSIYTRNTRVVNNNDNNNSTTV